MARKSPRSAARSSGRGARTGERAAKVGSGRQHGPDGAAKKKQGGRERREQRTEEKVRAYARELTEKERVALAVRDELYDGFWDRMREDLTARKEGRTYVFRLASRIEEDLKTIRKLSAFERRHNVNLSEYVEEGR